MSKEELKMSPIAVDGLDALVADPFSLAKDSVGFEFPLPFAEPEALKLAIDGDGPTGLVDPGKFEFSFSVEELFPDVSLSVNPVELVC